MSQAALREVEAAREKILSEQTVCAWCDKVCEDSYHLYMHLVMRHEEEVRQAVSNIREGWVP